MNILILGSGGREHALARAYSKSKKVSKVFVAPGNDFMLFQKDKTQTLPHIASIHFDGILDAVRKYKIDLVDVAQDDPLALGFVDKLKKQGIRAFGPSQKAAQIEWSKQWARNFMQKYGLPIPQFKSFNNEKNAITYINDFYKLHPTTSEVSTLYIKASGLALGKGALRAETKDQAKFAIESMQQFGNAGKTFLIEECLTGEEFSLFALCDGENYQIFSAAQDHKTVFEKDHGKNTGGMGCVSPVSIITAKVLKEIELTILKPFMKGMKKENRPYKGILYLGGMVTKHGIKIIEFNARWGDPEAEVIIPGIKTDYLSLIEKTTMQQPSTTTISFDHKIRISIAGCAYGYPTDYTKAKGKKIYGMEKAAQQKGVTIFGAGIKKQGNHFVVSGGRIFHIVGEGNNIQEAKTRAYTAMSMLYIEGNNLHYRTDIGWREQQRFTKISESL